MTRSLAHAAIVAPNYTDPDPAALAGADAAARASFLSAYRQRLSAQRAPRLVAPTLLRPFRRQQVLREIVYAARHLPRWMYQLAEWTTAPGAGYTLRYPGDTDDDVRLLTEVLVPELVAARAWQAS